MQKFRVTRVFFELKAQQLESHLFLINYIVIDFKFCLTCGTKKRFNVRIWAAWINSYSGHSYLIKLKQNINRMPLCRRTWFSTSSPMKGGGRVGSDNEGCLHA